MDKEKNGIRVRIHPELVKILEKLRSKMNEYTYGVINQEMTYYQASGILAKKINMTGIV